MCLDAMVRPPSQLPAPSTTELPLAEIYGLFTPATTDEKEFDASTPLTLPIRATNHIDENIDRDTRSADPVEKPVAPIFDGNLDTTSNYTGFVEVIVVGENGSLMSAYSGYLMWITPGPVSVTDSALGVAPEFTIALHVLIGLVVIVCILLIVLFILHNYTKTVSEEQGIDMNFTFTLLHLCRNVGGRHVPVSSSPPDMAPIAKADLAEAVAERHRDSDYGFQNEFEMLPDEFPDRTTRASEARENLGKNR